MKELITKFLLSLTLIIVIFPFTCFAQAPPQAISYQAVARDNNGNILSNKTVSLRFTIHDATAGGAVVYQETQSATTNLLGLVNLSIGTGAIVSGTFAGINWGSGPKYMQVEIDPAGGSNYTSLGTSQMLSVPYALYAANGGGSAPTGDTVIEVYGTSTLDISTTNYTLIPGLTATVNIPANSKVIVHTEGVVQNTSNDFDVDGYTEVEIALFIDGNPPTGAPTNGNGGYKIVTALDNSDGFGDGVYDNLTNYSINRTYNSSVLGVGSHTFSIMTEWDLGTTAKVSGGSNDFKQGVLSITIIK